MALHEPFFPFFCLPSFVFFLLPSCFFLPTTSFQIQCAAHRPPRVGVVMQRVVMHDSSFGRLIRIRFCRNHVKSSGSRGRNWPGMLRRPSEDRKFQKFVEVWPETDRRVRKKCKLDGRQTQKCAKSVPRDRPLHHPRPSRNSSASTTACFPLWGFGTLELQERALA